MGGGRAAYLEGRQRLGQQEAVLPGRLLQVVLEALGGEHRSAPELLHGAPNRTEGAAPEVGGRVAEFPCAWGFKLGLGLGFG